MNTVVLLVVAIALAAMLAPAAPTSRLQRGGASTADRLAWWKIHAPGAGAREQQASVRRAIELTTGLAAAVEAGLAPRAALPEVIADGAGDMGSDQLLLGVAAAAATDGGDVAAALLASERQHWRAIGVAWRVGEDSGAAFAPVLDRVAGSLRTDERVAREARSALATAKATAKMLSVLPLMGVAIGKGIGGDTFGFLLHTRPGIGCLILGLLFEAAGLLWVRRLVRKAEGNT